MTNFSIFFIQISYLNKLFKNNNIAKLKLFSIAVVIFILNVSLAFAKTVVVLQPHPDDEIMVCAHVKHLLNEGHDVKYIRLSDGESSWFPGGRLFNAYYNPDNGTVKENFPVVKGLGVPVDSRQYTLPESAFFNRPFETSAANPDGICTISQESVTISGPCDPANPDTYKTLTLAINNTSDLPVTGKLKGKDVCTIWIKAISANAWATNRLTDFVEQPINIAVFSLPSTARLPEYITTRYTATGGDGKIGGEVETGYFDMFGKDADLEWMNLEKDGHPFDDGLRPAYNNYNNQTTAYNAVKVVYDAQNNALNDHDSDGIPNEIETYEQAVFNATGFHCDILNYSNLLLENHPNIQVANNVPYGNSLFTLFLPPNWTKAGSYPVLLAGHGFGADNNSMYLKTNTLQARNAAKGIIVVKSNCGGRESLGINSNAIEDAGNFLVNQMSNYGADLYRVITNGASRAGNTALVWGANPNGYVYNVLAIHAFVPPIKIGSMGTLSLATFPSIVGCTDKILGSKNAYSYYYEDLDQGEILSVEEKASASNRILLGVDSLDEADNKSAYGYFGRTDLIGSLQGKRILISQGTHDSFMPMPYLLDFDYLLGEGQISHRVVIGYCYGHGFYEDTGDSEYTIEKLANGEDIVPFEGNSRVFLMPKKLVNMGTGNKTQRQGIVYITNDVIANIKSTNGYEDYFDEGHDATKLAFSATIPYTVGQGLPVTITLMGEEGKSWKIWARKEDGYRYAYRRSGVFGESINHPHEYAYGKEYVILNFNANTEPCSYEWFFEYDGKEIPNKFTTFMNPPRLPDFPEGVPVKAVTIVTAEEPFRSEYSHPEKSGGFNFGVDQYHPLLLKGNSFPNLEPIHDIAVNAGEIIELALSATDSDTDTLVYDLRDEYGAILKFDGLYFNGLTGQLIWQTTAGDIGVYSLVAIAKDGKGGVDTQAFTIEVQQ